MACFLLLCACDGAGEVDDVVSSGNEISFSSNMAEQGQGLTRADGQPLASDFVVYGYKDAAQIFPGYKVRYEAPNTYNYVGIGDQTIRYWDPSATKYSFWAYAGDGWQVGNDGKILSLNSHPLRIGKTGAIATDLSGDNLYASLVSRNPSVSTEAVKLSFSHVYSQVSMFFYYETMKSNVKSLRIDDVSFVPVTSSGKEVFNSGVVTVTYTESAESVYVIGTAGDTRPGLDFMVPELLYDKAGHGVSQAIQAIIPSTDHYKFYYPLPVGEYNPDFVLSLVVVEVGEDDSVIKQTPRSVVIPATYMNWKPNYAYRYFFKITADSSVALQYDVKVEPWQYGGYQDQEFKNW